MPDQEREIRKGGIGHNEVVDAIVVMTPTGLRIASDAPCPFCERIKLRHYDTAYFPDVVSFEPLNPVTPGHLLFVPRVHVEDAAESPATTSAVMLAAAIAARETGGDFNLITSIGPAATQTVRHLHIHLIPRREGDGLALPWTDQHRVGGRR